MLTRRARRRKERLDYERATAAVIELYGMVQSCKGLLMEWRAIGPNVPPLDLRTRTNDALRKSSTVVVTDLYHEGPV